MTKLSIAATAVRDAAEKQTDLDLRYASQIAAAALRAAMTAVGSEEVFHPNSKRTEGVKWCVQRIYAIADELEAQ